jgi:hypothetical protein
VTCIARQQTEKHLVICARNNRTNIYVTGCSAMTQINTRSQQYGKGLFSMRSVPRLYNPSQKYNSSDPRVEAGSNTSTVTLRVAGGDEKGSLKSETVKYGLKSQGTRTRERLRWQGPAAHTKDRPVLSSERATPGIIERNCQTYSIFRTEIKKRS